MGWLRRCQPTAARPRSPATRLANESVYAAGCPHVSAASLAPSHHFQFSTMAADTAAIRYDCAVLTLYGAKEIIVPRWIMWSLYTGRWWVDCYIWYSKYGTGRGCSPFRPLLAVPNLTVYPSTASVPITALLYNNCSALLICPLKG